MERRTQPGYEYHSCDFMDDGVYIDMNRLREYEDIDLTPEQIQELKERDTAKVPEDIKDEFGDGMIVCPNCRNHVINYFNRSCLPQFCMICGQRLKWE